MHLRENIRNLKQNYLKSKDLTNFQQDMIKTFVLFFKKPKQNVYPPIGYVHSSKIFKYNRKNIMLVQSDPGLFYFI